MDDVWRKKSVLFRVRKPRPVSVSKIPLWEGQRLWLCLFPFSFARSDGVLENRNIGLKFEENVCKKAADGIPEVLSFGFPITPPLQYYITPDRIRFNL